MLTREKLLALYASGQRNFAGAHLRGTTLWGANLRNADLWGANLTGAVVLASSHSLIAEILRQAAGGDIQQLMLAGLVLLQRH